MAEPDETGKLEAGWLDSGTPTPDAAALRGARRLAAVSAESELPEPHSSPSHVGGVRYEHHGHVCGDPLDAVGVQRPVRAASAASQADSWSASFTPIASDASSRATAVIASPLQASRPMASVR